MTGEKAVTNRVKIKPTSFLGKTSVGKQYSCMDKRNSYLLFCFDLSRQPATLRGYFSAGGEPYGMRRIKSRSVVCKASALLTVQ